jgi:hypothetical protein
MRHYKHVGQIANLIGNPPLEFVHFVEKVGQTIVFRGLSYLAGHWQVWL